MRNTIPMKCPACGLTHDVAPELVTQGPYCTQPGCKGVVLILAPGVQVQTAEGCFPPTSAPGVKHDQEKPDMSLLSPLWLLGVSRVLTFGKRKYAAWNWAKGLQLSRVLAAALRHIFAFLSGEDRDPETGECHLYHASCCLQFAAHLWETRPDMDDRFKDHPLNAYPHVPSK